MRASMEEREIRAAICKNLPVDTFARQPQRALWVVPLVAVIAGGTFMLIRFDVPWYLGGLMAFVLANAYAMTGFLAHEALHGSMMRSRWLQHFVGYIGFGPFLISPHLWRFWHNQMHHGHANDGNRDPDSFGTVLRYRKIRLTRLLTRLAPGAQTWYSYLFLCYWFTFHGQDVLWIQARYIRAFERFDRRRSMVETFLFVTLWGWLALLAGPYKSLYVIVLPMAGANFILMSYIATNHFLRPQSPTSDALDSAMSVTTLSVIDKLHFNFSHHVEHHLFPSMSPKFAPRVRGWLQQHVGNRYVCPVHWKALVYLYKTPRLYLDADTLFSPCDNRTVDIGTITQALGPQSKA